MHFKISKSSLVFILSPFLATYFILKDIYHNRVGGYIWFVILFSLLSYLYIPGDNGDKSYYIHLYDYFSSISLHQAVAYIDKEMADYIFFYIIMAFAGIGVSFSVLSGIVTGITLGIIVTIYRRTIAEANLSKFMTLVLFMSLIGAISLLSIFSGMRFYLSVSFVILGFYYCIVEDKKTVGLIALLFAVTIHFSAITFLLAALLYLVFNKPPLVLKIAYLLSFYFVFVSPLALLAPFMGIESIYAAKFLGYTGGKEFEITNSGHAIFLFINKLWYFLFTLFAFLNLRHNRDGWFQVLLIVLIVANVTYLFPWVFNRYAYVALVVFVFVLVENYRVHRFNYFFITSYFILSMMTTSLDILVDRNHFRDSFVRMYALTLPTILATDPLEGKQFTKGTL